MTTLGICCPRFSAAMSERPNCSSLLALFQNRFELRDSLEVFGPTRGALDVDKSLQS